MFLYLEHSTLYRTGIVCSRTIQSPCKIAIRILYKYSTHTTVGFWVGIHPTGGWVLAMPMLEPWSQQMQTTCCLLAIRNYFPVSAYCQVTHTAHTNIYEIHILISVPMFSWRMLSFSKLKSLESLDLVPSVVVNCHKRIWTNKFAWWFTNSMYYNSARNNSRYIYIYMCVGACVRVRAYICLHSRNKLWI